METLYLNHYKGYKQDVKVTVVLCYKTISEHELLRNLLRISFSSLICCLTLEENGDSELFL